MESHNEALEELADDDNLYVLCPMTNEILKQGKGSLEESDTWGQNVYWLTNIYQIQIFRQIMTERKLHASWGKDWSPDHDENDGNVPLPTPRPPLGPIPSGSKNGALAA